jgi:hypothetical protein
LTDVEHELKRFVVRSAPRPAASLAIHATGVALPPTVAAKPTDPRLPKCTAKPLPQP